MTNQAPKKQVNREDVVFTRLEDEAVILNLKTKYYFTINDTALRVWELLAQEGGTPVETIVTTLLDEYDVERQSCEVDVHEILSRFEREGLIKSHAPQL